MSIFDCKNLIDILIENLDDLSLPLINITNMKESIGCILLSLFTFDNKSIDKD
ncbi:MULTISPECIES: hypothetical protein [unclassified Prevotella]|uniref:hypothetical protein n=1 Tax=unclassified Prevotella TaxID=2638335 RepID=UPI0012E3B403|nr:MULTISPECIES: hypothetical protein [unclassified Prevotella]